MSREVVIVQRCDTCRELATQTFVVAISHGETHPVPHLIDVCDVHAKPLTELVDAWSGLAPWMAQRTSEPRATRQRAVDPEDPANVACDLCGAVMRRNSLVHHIWNKHVGKPRPLSSGTTCPDCGLVFKTGPATGMHRARAHGYDPLAEAYAEARKGGKR